MVGPRRQTAKFIDEHKSSKLHVLWVIFNTIISSVAILGLLGIILFFLVHRGNP